jgi:hypothetical protein
MNITGRLFPSQPGDVATRPSEQRSVVNPEATACAVDNRCTRQLWMAVMKTCFQSMCNYFLSTADFFEFSSASLATGEYVDCQMSLPSRTSGSCNLI